MLRGPESLSTLSLTPLVGSGCLSLCLSTKKTLPFFSNVIPKESEQPPSDDSLSRRALRSALPSLSHGSPPHHTQDRIQLLLRLLASVFLFLCSSTLCEDVLSFVVAGLYPFLLHSPLCPSFSLFLTVSFGTGLQSQKIQKDTVLTLLSAF